KRVLVCIGLRELLTIGVKIDAFRGLPVVHVNFLGYDEQAHRRGPSSAYAHWSLKGIDRAVKNICRAAHRSARRDYQVWIFSDHGQEATTPYERLCPEGLEHAISAAIGAKGVSPGKARTGRHKRITGERGRSRGFADCFQENVLVLIDE